jgi:hypothetical protein
MISKKIDEKGQYYSEKEYSLLMKPSENEVRKNQKVPV